MRKLYVQGSYDVADVRYQLKAATETFVVLGVEGQEVTMTREAFEAAAVLEVRHQFPYLTGVHSSQGLLIEPRVYGGPPNNPSDGVWSIDLRLVPQEAWICGRNP